MRKLKYTATLDQTQTFNCPEHFIVDGTTFGRAVDILLEPYASWNPRSKLLTGKGAEPYKAYKMLTLAYERVYRIAAIFDEKIPKTAAEETEAAIVEIGDILDDVSALKDK